MKEKSLYDFLNLNKYEKIKSNSLLFEDYNYLLSNSDDCQISLKTMLEVIKCSSQFNLFCDLYDELCAYALYESDMHGINHTEKVMLFGYYIGLNQNLTDEEMKVLLYGCMYHDIGRVNDFEDRRHGYISSEMVKSLNLNLDSEELMTLKAIMVLHSEDDNYFDKLVEYYSIKNKDQLKKLLYILKDADALDRVRLKCKDLDPNFLRYPISKTLLLASCDLNYNYEEKKFVRVRV